MPANLGSSGIAAVTCTPATLAPLASTACTVTLSGTGGGTIGLSSSSTNLTVPLSLTIPSGSGSGTFFAATNAFAADQSVVVTATLDGVSKSTSLSLAAATGNAGNSGISAIACNPASIAPLASTACTVTLGGSGGGTVGLSSSSTNFTVPSSLTIPSGSASGTFFAATSAFTAGQSVILTATLNGSSITTTLALAVATGNSGISAIACNPTAVAPLSSTACTVTLSGPGGGTVGLTSNSTNLTVPASLTIPSGSASGTFFAATNAFAADQSVIVTATLSGSSKSTTLSLAAAPANSGIVSIACNPATVAPLSSTACTVTLSGAGGGSVGLTSSSTNLTAPASLTIPAGSASGVFFAATNAFTADQTVTVTGTLSGSSKGTTLSLVAAPTNSGIVSIACNPATAGPLSTSVCTVTLSGSGGGTIGLTSSSTNLAVPASLTIPPGSASGVFNATANAFTVDQSVTVTGTLSGASKSTTLSLVVPPASTVITSIACNPAILAPLSSTTCTVTLSGPSGGTVGLTSNSTDFTVPTSYTIPSGSATGVFSATANTFTVDKTVTVTGTLNGFSKAATLSLTVPTSNSGIASISCNPTTVAPLSSSSCTVTLNGSGGGTVGLTSSSTDFTVPSSLTIPSGSASGVVFAATNAFSVDQTVTLTGTLDGSSKSTTLTLAAAPSSSGLTAIACNPATIGPLISTACTVTLSGSGGGTIALSSNSINFPVPSSVTIPPGSAGGLFNATATAFTVDETVTVTGTLNGSSKVTTLTLVAPVVNTGITSIACNPAAIGPLSSSACTVTLTGPGGGTIGLNSSSTNLTVPASLTIPTGAASGVFFAAANAFAADQTVTITGALNGSSKTTTLSLVAPPPNTGISSIACNPTSAGPLSSSACTVTLNGPSGGTIGLSSNSISLTVPSSLTIPSGSASGVFFAATGAFTTDQLVTVTGTMNGSAQSTTLSLVAPQANTAIASIACNPTTVGPLASSACTVTLTGPGGGTIGLNSSSTNLTVPTSLTIPSGSAAGVFFAATSAFSADQTATVTGTLNGSSKSTTLALAAPAGNIGITSITSIVCNPTTVGPLSSSACTVTLTGPGGGTISLNSSSTNLTVPTSLTIPSGSAAGVFFAATSAFSADQTATVTGTLNGSSKSTTLALAAPAGNIGITSITSIVCNPTTVGPLASSACTVTLTGAGGGTIGLNSSSTNLTVPTSLTIPSGSAAGVFFAATNAFTTDQTVTVTGTLNSASKSTTLSLAAPVVNTGIATIVCNPTTVGPLSSSACTVTLTGAGGGTVGLSSSSANLTVPPSLTISSGSASGVFSATANAFIADQSASITATLNGSSQTTTVALVVPSANSEISAIACSPASVGPGSAAACRVTLSGAGGGSIGLHSSSSNFAVPSSLTIPQGSASGVFFGAASAFGAEETVTITGTLNGTSKATTISLVLPLNISGIVTTGITDASATISRQAPLFLLHSDASEVSGLTNGSTVTPAAAPPGFSGTIAVNAGGSVNFAPAHAGDGVYFQQCCSNTAGAYYKFTGGPVGSIFNVNQGQVSFYLTSRQSYAQRLASGTSYRQVFDVRDDSNHLFGFTTQATSAGLVFHFLAGADAATNAAGYYVVPAGTEESLFGNGVTVKVTLTWNANTAMLYLNDGLVKQFTYTAPAANWSPASNFDLGAYEYLSNGGYNVCDDIIDEFTVTPGASQQLLSALPTNNEMASSVRPVITRLQNGANAAAPAACSPEAVATLVGRFLPDDAAPVADRSGRARSLAGTRIVINGSYVPILFASASQVEFLCPAVPPATSLAIAVETASGLSNRLETRVEEASPGIFVTSEPNGSAPGATVSIRATGMNWLAKFPAIRLVARIGERVVPIESNTPDLESPGVSRLTLTLPPDVSGDSVPVVIQVITTDGDSIESNAASIPVDTRHRAGSGALIGR